jgi:hypothetical protein
LLVLFAGETRWRFFGVLLEMNQNWKLSLILEIFKKSKIKNQNQGHLILEIFSKLSEPAVL